MRWCTRRRKQTDQTFHNFVASDQILCLKKTTNFEAQHVLKCSVGLVNFDCLKYFCLTFQSPVIEARFSHLGLVI